MRVVFFGTPELSVPTLEMLVDAGHQVVLVVTQADKRRTRGNEVTPSPVKAAAQRLGLPVSHAVKDALDVNAELGVLVAFGRIIKPAILNTLNIINLHPSLLPRWRGATPVEAAILAGDTETGICVMQLQDEMDAGPIYAQYSTPIKSDEKAQALYERLFVAGNQTLREMLAAPALPTPVEQSGEATYCGKISNQDLNIDWSKSPEEIVRLTRVGRAWTTFRSKRFLVLDATVTNGELEMITVQPEGKGPMDAKAWANGAHMTADEHFGD